MKKKILYLEFLYPVRDYMETIKLNEAIYEWGGPVIAVGCSLILLSLMDGTINYTSFSKYIAGIMAILIGFSITSLTILATASGEVITKLKAEDSERKIGGVYIKVYRWLLACFTFALFGEITSIVGVSLLYIVARCGAGVVFLKVIFSINIWLVTHVVLVSLRNITNFYLVFSRPPNEG